MQRASRTIYQAARFNAGISGEHAARLLHISIESLRAYEAGRTVPPSDVVLGMVDAYGAPWLAYQHLKTADPIGRRYLPDIDCRDLPTAVLRLQKEMADMARINGDMVDVTCDGSIDDHEQSRWSVVVAELKHLIGAALSVTFSPRRQKEKAAQVGG